MNHSARLLIAATLIFAAGCVKSDWIDRTLVTVDVTGTWQGSGGPDRDLLFELKQEGTRVEGFMRLPTGGSSLSYSSASRVNPGPVEGTVAGDVFRFRRTNGSLEGALTVSGDEMSGHLSWMGGSQISLRRVDPPSPPGSPPR